MTSHDKIYPIREVAWRANVSSYQLRYWEQVGLLAPDYSDGGQRLYSEQDIFEARRIAALIRIGASLVGIAREKKLSVTL